MLNSRTARLIIALLAAILIWGYVVGEVNPAKTKTIRNVPITFTYEETLNERGLAISSVQDEFINVEISGARAILGDISATDISATVNVASAQRGENEISISIRVPSGITVNKQSEARTIVNVETYTQKSVNVNIVYAGGFQEGDQGRTVTTSASQVIVSGAESLVESVAAAQGTIDASQLEESISALPCQLEAVDEAGNIVNGIRLSQRNISVTAVLARTKTVKLVVPIINAESEDYVKTAEVPEEIVVLGNADIIKNLEEIKAKEIDLSSIVKSTEIKMEFDLPTGVEIVGDAPVLKVEVDPIEEKSIALTGSDIEIVGGKTGYSYYVQSSTQITATLKDKKSVLDTVDKSNIRLSIDVSNLSEGGDVAINASSSPEIASITISPANITVAMEATPDAQSGN